MEFNLAQGIEMLARTPPTLNALLKGLPENWIKENEGPDTWSPFDIIGHLIHGEKTDWMVRTKLILSEQENRTFEPFDRFAQFQESQGKTIENLLTTFQQLREKNLDDLRNLDLQPKDLDRTGYHPALGEVTLKQLLSTWVVHDLNHVYQISRVMAKLYSTEVGPWKAYLKALNN